MKTRSTEYRKQRRAIALVAVLACILIITMLGATLTKEMAAQYRQSRTLQQQSQAFWIAESAVRRALYKLDQSPEYRGETWKVPAETLDSEFSARAVIAVQTTKSAMPGYQVRVTTYYPDTKRARIMVEREVVVEAPAKDKAGKNSK